MASPKDVEDKYASETDRSQSRMLGDAVREQPV